MKYLKRFESGEEEDIYGITEEDIKYLFIELQDEGWNVFTRFTSKLHQYDFNTEAGEKDLKLGLVPHIEVRIKKNMFGFMTNSEVDTELHKLSESDIFKETIQVAGYRLQDYGWKIKNIKREMDYLSISLCKINI